MLEQSDAAAPFTDDKGLSDCPEVRFSDIMDAPDNVNLNYCYASQKIDAGDFKSALPTLERLMLLAPQRTDVRMLYASVLYRLDMLDASKQELKNLRTERNKALVDQYLSKIEERQNPLKQSLTFSLGGHYDTNRNAAPESDTFLVGGAPLAILNEDSRENDDFGIIGIARYNVEYGVGEFNQHTLLGSFTYFKDDQTGRDELDLGSFIARGGAQFDLSDVKLTAQGSYTNMELSGEKFYQAHGAHIRLDKQLLKAIGDKTLEVWLAGDALYEDYGNITGNTSLQNRTGKRLDAELGGAMWLSPKHRVSAALDFTHKDARVNFQTFDAWGASLNHLWVVGNGHFLSSHVTYLVRDYEGSDPLVTANNARERRESPLRLGSTYTLPVAHILDAGGMEFGGRSASQIGFFKNFNLALSGEYVDQSANITNYEYDNVRGQFLFTKRFAF